MTDDDLWEKFSRPLPGLGVESEPLTLDPDVEEKIRRFTRDAARARAAAIVSAQNYMIL